VALGGLVAYEGWKHFAPAKPSAGSSPAPTPPVSADGGGSGGGALSGVYPAPSAQLQSWTSQAVQRLNAAGFGILGADQQNILTVLQNEGGDNPTAYEATGGTWGPAQVQPGTFQGVQHDYPQLGLTNILDPVQNIVAGIAYAIQRYGSTSQIPGIVSLRTGQPAGPFPQYCANHPGFGLYCPY
jgi:hypothetical protein